MEEVGSIRFESGAYREHLADRIGRLPDNS
jgi:hypothetical protein